MANKLYKRTYTKEDEILVNWYVFYVLKGELFLRVHEKNTPAERFSYRKLRSGANVNTGIGEALFFDKNNGDSHKYIVELIVKEPSGNISTVYYTDNTDKKYGITFDIFNRAKTAYTEAVKKDLNVEFKMLYTILLTRGYNSDDAWSEATSMMRSKYPDRWE